MNVTFERPFALAAFAVALGLVWLSSRWFFVPSISKSLLAALLTHNPLALVQAAYLLAVVQGDAGVPLFNARTSVLLVGLWLPFAAWETSRKIRIPADETDYATYSKLFGWKLAPFAPAAILMVATLCLTLATRYGGMGWAYPAVIALVTALFLAAAIRFRLQPNAANAKLQPLAELYIVASMVGLAMAAGIHQGVRWV